MIFQVPKPFEEVGLQWFAEGDPDPGPGGEPGGEPAGELGGEPSGGGEPPTEPPVSKPKNTIPTFLNYVGDKYKKDPKYIEDLSKHKNWTEVVDRMYAAEEKTPRVPESPDKYEFDEIKFPDRLQSEEHKEYREKLGAELGNVQKEVAQLVWDAISSGKLEDLPKTLANAFTKRLFGYDQAAWEDESKARADGEETLKANWKADYDKNAEVARRAITTYGKEKLTALFERKGVANDPELLEAFYEIGKAIGPHFLVPGSGGPPEPSPKDEEQQEHKDRYKNSPDLIADAERAEQAGGATPEVPEELKGRYPSME